MKRVRPNKNGVYCNVESVELGRCGKRGRAIAEVAFCDDGFWRAGYELGHNDGAILGLPSKSDRVTFVSRMAAIDAIERLAISWFTEHLEDRSATIRKESKAILKQIGQRDRRGQLDMFPEFRMAA